MQGGKIKGLADSFDHAAVDAHRLGEAFTAVYHAVSDCPDLTEVADHRIRFVQQALEHVLHRFVVIARTQAVPLPFCLFDLDRGDGRDRSNALDVSPCPPDTLCCVDKLKLER